MHIEHIALWVDDLERMKSFYESYFTAKSNEKYHNNKTGFESYFLSFESGCRLELMKRLNISENTKDYHNQKMGLAHFAISVGSKQQVDVLTQKLSEEGFEIASPPRVTGDRYYESVILDPENNTIEITE